jgi:hypothetical protein
MPTLRWADDVPFLCCPSNRVPTRALLESRDRLVVGRIFETGTCQMKLYIVNGIFIFSEEDVCCLKARSGGNVRNSASGADALRDRRHHYRARLGCYADLGQGGSRGFQPISEYRTMLKSLSVSANISSLRAEGVLSRTHRSDCARCLDRSTATGALCSSAAPIDELDFANAFAEEDAR